MGLAEAETATAYIEDAFSCRLLWGVSDDKGIAAASLADGTCSTMSENIAQMVKYGVPTPEVEDLVANPIKRLHKELKRSTDVVGIFPQTARCCDGPARS